jgi:hypothetical protein
MGIPAGSRKVVLTWSLPGGDKAQCAFWESGAVAGDATDTTAGLMAASGLFTTWIGTIKPLWSSTTVLSGLDLYLYTGGTAASEHGHADLNIIGTGGQNHPNQCACVLTLRTALASRRGRGRMYIPANGVVVGTGVMAAGIVDAAVTGTASHFSGINAAAAIKVVVVSQTGSLSSQVTQVSADYVPDTQRRRVNKLTSSRKTVNV